VLGEIGFRDGGRWQDGRTRIVDGYSWVLMGV
jgi:hypothetical protein